MRDGLSAPSPEPCQRVQQAAVPYQFEMQVAARRQPRAPHVADVPPDAHGLAFPHADQAQVRIQRLIPACMPDTHEVPVTAAVTGGGDLSVAGRIDRLAGRRSQVHALVEHPPSFHRVHPCPER